MRDSLGGTVSLVIIVVFIVVALGYMAFNVNYTKAFRMKNKIISTYEDFEGDCSTQNCRGVIKNYAKTLGYAKSGNFTCPSGYSPVDNLYCVKQVFVEELKDVVRDRNTRYYYKIITKINVEVPIINNILDLRIFYITGDTKTFTES